MWNERDIWLRHYERMARLRHEASVARLRHQRCDARQKGDILTTWLRTAVLNDLRRHLAHTRWPDAVDDLPRRD
jgi:hypothetical protein